MCRVWGENIYSLFAGSCHAGVLVEIKLQGMVQISAALKSCAHCTVGNKSPDVAAPTLACTLVFKLLWVCGSFIFMMIISDRVSACELRLPCCLFVGVRCDMDRNIALSSCQSRLGIFSW